MKFFIVIFFFFKPFSVPYNAKLFSLFFDHFDYSPVDHEHHKLHFLLNILLFSQKSWSKN